MREQWPEILTSQLATFFILVQKSHYRCVLPLLQQHTRQLLILIHFLRILRPQICTYLKNIPHLPDIPEKQEVSNGPCEHLRACEQCVHFCKHEQWSILSCEQRGLQKSQMAISEHFVNFPPAGISHYENIVLRPVIWPWHLQNITTGAKLDSMLRSYHG